LAVVLSAPPDPEARQTIADKTDSQAGTFADRRVFTKRINHIVEPLRFGDLCAAIKQLPCQYTVWEDHLSLP